MWPFPLLQTIWNHFAHNCACSSMMTASSCCLSFWLSASWCCKLSTSLLRSACISRTCPSRTRSSSSKYPCNTTQIQKPPSLLVPIQRGRVIPAVLQQSRKCDPVTWAWQRASTLKNGLVTRSVHIVAKQCCSRCQWKFRTAGIEHACTFCPAVVLYWLCRREKRSDQDSVAPCSPGAQLSGEASPCINRRSSEDALISVSDSRSIISPSELDSLEKISSSHPVFFVAKKWKESRKHCGQRFRKKKTPLLFVCFGATDSTLRIRGRVALFFVFDCFAQFKTKWCVCCVWHQTLSSVLTHVLALGMANSLWQA